MSKYSTKDLWNKFYGDADEQYDYAGRLMKKSACGNPNSKYHPTIDHIRPIAEGGRDIIPNIEICHRTTNEEKGDEFPHWKANKQKWKAIRIKGKSGAYKIVKNED